MSELDKLFARIYEDNVLGRLDDTRYSALAATYKEEQEALSKRIAAWEAEQSEAQQRQVDTKTLYRGLMDYLEVRELTPEIVNMLIARIEVHNPEKKYSHNTVKVDITFTAIGLYSAPQEAELAEMVQKLAAKKARKQKSA